MKPRMLVMELWGLGDLVIATPFLQAAAERFSVTLLARPFAKELQPIFWPQVEVVPFTAPWTAFHGKYRVWRWPWREMMRIRREIQARQFDYAVSARWDPRDHIALQWSAARERIGFPRLKSSRYLTRSLVRPAPLAHRYEYWRVAGESLGMALPARGKIIFGGGTRSNLVLVHSGARLPLRVWPLENFQLIVRRLREQNYQVQVACDPDQRGIWKTAGEDPSCPDSVTALIRLLKTGGLFIGNDSGPGHLAAACGLPTFTLFGPQLHEWFAPLHPISEVVEGKACPYKPCSDYCRFAKPFCLQDISPQEVWPRVESFVRRNLNPT